MHKLKSFPPKHPTAKLDYVFDWAPERNDTGPTNWLEDGSIITDYAIIAEDGIVVESHGLINEASAVRVWISGGSIGVDYEVSCSIMTSSSPAREDTRTVIIPVRER